MSDREFINFVSGWASLGFVFLSTFELRAFSPEALLSLIPISTYPFLDNIPPELPVSCVHLRTYRLVSGHLPERNMNSFLFVGMKRQVR